MSLNKCDNCGLSILEAGTIATQGDKTICGYCMNRPINTMTYQEAKRAVELFESEYMGQNQTELWRWAIKEAMKTK